MMCMNCRRDRIPENCEGCQWNEKEILSKQNTKLKRIEHDNVKMIFVCPNCKKEHNMLILDHEDFYGAWIPICYICNNSGVTCNFVGLEIEVKTEGQDNKKEVNICIDVLTLSVDVLRCSH